MSRNLWGRWVFAAGLVGCGVAGIVYRNVLVYETLDAHSRSGSFFSVVTGLLLVVAGLGLVSRFKAPASWVASIVLLFWDLVVTGAEVVQSPLNEGAWLDLGMATMVAVAAWLLVGSGNRLRTARTIFGLALIPVGLSHFFFWQISLGLVPSWVPAPAFWVALVGVAHAAAGLAVLFGVLPRLAAMLEAGQLLVFAILVWLPRVIAKPSVQFNWTEMLGTLLIGGAAWVMADALAAPKT